MKFNHGESVTCTISGNKITNAKISIDDDGTPFICQNQLDGDKATDRLGYSYSWVIGRNFTQSGVSDLKSSNEHLIKLDIIN